MKDSLYQDVKSGLSRFKRDAVVAVFAIACAALIVIILSSIKTSSTETFPDNSPLLQDAIAQTKGETPTVFSRKDINTESKINVWVFDDTDHHVLIQKNDSYALFAQELFGDTIKLWHVAGGACASASVDIVSKRIVSLECDWAKFNRNN